MTKTANTVTLTTNKSDWTGEEITVVVNLDDLSWEQFGYRFQLVPVAMPDDPELIAVLGNLYRLMGEGWTEPLASVSDRDAFCYAPDVDLYYGRRGENADPKLAMVEGAIKYICNTV